MKLKRTACLTQLGLENKKARLAKNTTDFSPLLDLVALMMIHEALSTGMLPMEKFKIKNISLEPKCDQTNKNTLKLVSGTLLHCMFMFPGRDTFQSCQ